MSKCDDCFIYNNYEFAGMECCSIDCKEVKEWLTDHDKQIKDEVIDELITNALDCDNCYVSIYQLKQIGMKMKGEQNE